jgi:predicted nucleic acid-binding protein
MIVLDTSVAVAFMNRQEDHEKVAALMETAVRPLHDAADSGGD